MNLIYNTHTHTRHEVIATPQYNRTLFTPQKVLLNASHGTDHTGFTPHARARYEPAASCTTAAMQLILPCNRPPPETIRQPSCFQANTDSPAFGLLQNKIQTIRRAATWHQTLQPLCWLAPYADRQALKQSCSTRIQHKLPSAQRLAQHAAEQAA